MSKDNPLIGHWKPPPELPLEPQQVVFGVLGVGKTYSVPESKEKETTGEEGESSA